MTANGLPSRFNVQVAPTGSVLTVMVWLEPVTSVAQPVHRRTTASKSANVRDIMLSHSFLAVRTPIAVERSTTYQQTIPGARNTWRVTTFV
jgi:hypothetical protein